MVLRMSSRISRPDSHTKLVRPVAFLMKRAWVDTTRVATLRFYLRVYLVTRMPEFISAAMPNTAQKVER